MPPLAPGWVMADRPRKAEPSISHSGQCVRRRKPSPATRDGSNNLRLISALKPATRGWFKHTSEQGAPHTGPRQAAPLLLATDVGRLLLSATHQAQALRVLS